MAIIKAPFNFVPLNKHVFIPSWSEAISMDIPFCDGLSGTIDINIKAESPILVSDGGERGQTHYFCHTPTNSRYFIPGTSVKGAIRNVLEILAFGKMSFTQNRSFTIRDLYRGKKGKEDNDEVKTDGDFYLEKLNPKNIHCGWMRKTSAGCVIDDCGIPWRISVERVDEMLDGVGISLGLKDFVLDGTKYSNSNENRGNRFAKKKYDMLRDRSGATSYEDILQFLTATFVNDDETDVVKGERIFKRQGVGGKTGTIVFTGQPGAREKKGNKWEGKFFEFIFPKESQREKIHVPEGVFRTFEAIHKDSPDYTEFRRKQLNEGKAIPVFFTYGNNVESDVIDSIGIAYMYRYPAFNSVFNGIPMELLDTSKHDLPECLFGFSNPKESLRGRVTFSHAFLKGIPHPIERRYALASPHPSYYPLYLGNGQSWNSQTISIAGRKRYPVRNVQRGNRGTSNMESSKRPLDRGSEFDCKIRFFNLMPIELGAILSSIDFCGHDDCFHSLGQGKPLGYGKVKITVQGVSFSGRSIDTTSARKAFVEAMNEESESKQWPKRWENSVQLRELFAMARGIPDGREGEFTYMEMSVKKEGEDKKHNEFKDALKAYIDDGIQLGRFTQILSNSVPISVTQDIASLTDERKDVESYLICKEKVYEIVKSGFLPEETLPEELVWMESVLINMKDVFGDDLDELLKSYSEMIKPLKEVLEEQKAKESEEREARLAQEREKEKQRLAQEREMALKQKEEERLAKNRAKQEWKEEEKQKSEKASFITVAPTPVSIEPIGFCGQLEQAPSVGQLTKLIEKQFKKEGKRPLTKEELEALTKGIGCVMSSLKEKFGKAEQEQKGLWRAEGSIWKKVVELIGMEQFTSAFPIIE